MEAQNGNVDGNRAPFPVGRVTAVQEASKPASSCARATFELEELAKGILPMV